MKTKTYYKKLNIKYLEIEGLYHKLLKLKPIVFQLSPSILATYIYIYRVSYPGYRGSLVMV
jgi:hypothetical protein